MFKLGPREILIGLGSNSPDALGKLREARRRLRQNSHFILKNSSAIYESDALLPPGAPPSWNIPFLNAALKIEMQGGCDCQGIAAAEFLLWQLKEIERSMGRTEGPRWSPRCIDLDLLDWGGAPVASEAACVPHPELHKRPFAFLPAEDCALCLVRPKQATGWRYAPPESVPSRTRPGNLAWPELVAILNITPDSFSGAMEPAALMEAARAALAEGATVLDLGAESTRPGADAITAEEEQARLMRVLPDLTCLREEFDFQLSLDSRNPNTVGWALERFPLDWLNDVEGFTQPEMLALAKISAKNTSLRFLAMHSLGVPPNPERTLSVHQDPVEQILAWGENRLRAFSEIGVDPAKVILDPGIGFGKTTAQNFALLGNTSTFSRLPNPWLIGHSRKRFLDPSAIYNASERDLETAILTASLAGAGIDYLRVHAVSLQARALALGNRQCEARKLP